MKKQLLSTTLCLCLLALRAAATTYYVDINSPDPTPPYTSWSTAATNIQDAIAETVNGDSVLVNPGVYQSVDVTNAIFLQGVNGQAETLINGSKATRCVYLVNGATLAGFTLANGNAVNGGGIYCASTVGNVISNCTITGNVAVNGGGVYQGTFFNCSVSQNLGESSGSDGGGVYGAVLINCMIVSNSIYGGFGCGVYNSNVTNSIIADNSQLLAFSPTTYGGGAYGGNLDHCNIVGNSAEDGGGTYQANLVNCINYYNTWNTNGGIPYSSNFDGGTINYTCTAGQGSPGPKDISSDPQLASFSHISLGSPCRGAGIAAASSGVDIDGNPWANPPSMGCFEPYPGSETGAITVAVSAPFTNWAPGFALNLQAIISGPVYSNVWNFGDGTFITNEPYVSHAWTAPGTYPVTVTAFNDSYQAGVTGTLSINVAVPSVYYVNLNSFNPVPPYLTWATAAVHIQDAVNVAVPGSTVLVTNGTTNPYYDGGGLTNTAAFYMVGGATAPDGNFYRVMITNAVTVQSVNGPATTYIWGLAPQGYSAKLAYLTNGAELNGFTLTNFSQNSYPGEMSATPTNSVITNCLLTQYVTVNSGTLDNCTLALHSSSANSTLNSCIISNNSEVTGGVLNNCLLVNNTNSSFGSAAALAEQGYPLVLNNCLISNNVTQYGVVYSEFTTTPMSYTNCILNNCVLSQNQGSGAFNAELNNCLISSNTAVNGDSVQDGLLVNCTFIGNSNADVVDNAVLTSCTIIGNAGTGAHECTLDQCTLFQNVGRTGGGAWNSVLNNCLIISNVTTTVSGTGGGVYQCKSTNCIIAYNVATNGGGASLSTLVNCTVIANTALNGGGMFESTAQNCILYHNAGGDFYPNTSLYPLNYCCVSTPVTYGIRNITNAPLFVAAGNFHLQSSSPCINSGNNAYITDATDLDGNPRIRGGTVDIGAYEYQTPTSVISYAYLQQYGLPTDGSVDSLDLDGTAFNVYQDWVAGLNPTNSASILAMLTPVPKTNATGVIVTWQSISGIPYFLQRSTNLTSQPTFSPIQNNIIGQTNTTSYTDTTAINGVPYFYRVGVIAP